MAILNARRLFCLGVFIPIFRYIFPLSLVFHNFHKAAIPRFVRSATVPRAETGIGFDLASVLENWPHICAPKGMERGDVLDHWDSLECE